MSHMVYRSLAYACIALGAVGLALPLVPTTPFLLLAAWAAPKGSPRLTCWLQEHPRFGPSLQAWREQRAVPRRAKQLACLLLALSWATLAVNGSPLSVLAVTGMLFIAVALFVLTRPTARRT